MVRRNARLIPTTEKSVLATPLWSDSEFKTLLGEQMDLIVTEKVRQELTQKYEIHPDKTWSVDECKKVLGASIRKNNVKGIYCHREFSVTLATQQSQHNSDLEKQNNELRARVSTLTKKLNLRAVQAAHLALQASSGMVLGQTVNVPSRSVRTNESSKSHFCHLLPLGKLVSNSHSPEYCYTACTSHEPILMYDVCND